MRLCYIADYRSTTAHSWVKYFIENGHEVHVIATFPYHGDTAGLASLTLVPLGLARLRGNRFFRRHFAVTAGHETANARPLKRALGIYTRELAASAERLYSRIAPYEATLRATHVERLVQAMQPDMVHAMRVPFEGILAAAALRHVRVPLLVSTWGNDFTLYANRAATVGSATRRVLERCSALHADCQRDVVLAAKWGLADTKPTIVLPGSGGVQLDVFQSRSSCECERGRWQIPADVPVVFNPRNFRPGSVRNDTFFASMPLVLAKRPDTVFICVGMNGNPIAERWIDRFNVRGSVRLLPSVERSEMAKLFQLADVTVSPTVHDGTPNSLLEGMACGAFPVAGDIESVREWITDGENGLLCDPTHPASIATAILRAIEDTALRNAAAVQNRALISQHADYAKVMREAERFYERVAGSSQNRTAA